MYDENLIKGSDNLSRIFREIKLERERQDEKWGVQNHLPIEWVAILTEEVGEVSKEALEYHFKYTVNGSDDEAAKAEKLAKYKAELIQVAAVAVSMLECIERNNGK